MTMIIFKKNIYERRISLFLWFLSVIAFVVLTILLFPALRDSLGESLQDVPESVEKFLGNANDYQTLSGYVDLQVITQMVFLTIIMAVMLGSALIAGEEKSGVLHTQLARPITRARVYWEKVASLAVMTAIVTWIGIFVGVVVGSAVVGESVNILRLFQASGMTWLITFFFAVLAYSIGAATGKRALAGIIAGSYAFIAYMLTALSQLATSLEKLNTISVFHYFNTPSVMKTGLDIQNIIILSVLIVVSLLLGFIAFRRRDLSNR